VAARGTRALNVTGKYFSEDVVFGKPHYEDWTERELAERLAAHREITVKTNRGVFHGRVGAKAAVVTSEGTLTGEITEVSLMFKKISPFVAVFKINEE
jgi:hypothetical protein